MWSVFTDEKQLPDDFSQVIFHLPKIRSFFWILVPAAFYQRVHLTDRGHKDDLLWSQGGHWRKLTSNSFSEAVSKFRSGLKYDMMILDSFSVGEVKHQTLQCSFLYKHFPLLGFW